MTRVKAPIKEFVDGIHKWQKEILRDFDYKKFRFFLINWHRRARKTTLAINLLIREATSTPNQRFGYITSTYTAAKNIVWRDPNMIKKYLPMELVRKMNETELYVEFTNGSILSLHGSDNPDCYDDKTQISTKEGWKFFKDLTISDKVMTLNPNTYKAEWQNPYDIICEDYDGEMVSYKNSRIDLLVTPNHKFYVQKRTKTGWKDFGFVEAKDLTGGMRIIRQTGRAGACVDKDYMRFIGIYMAEGSAYGCCGGDITKRRGNYSINIASFKSEQNEWVKKVLTKCRFNWSRCNAGYRFNKKSEWEKLIVLGNKYTKRLPAWVWDCDKESLEALFEGMVMGDGWCKDGCYSYASVCEGLIDDFQTLCALLGKSSHKVLKKQFESTLKNGKKITPTRDIYIASVHNTKAWYFDNSLGKEKYKGKIYCCSVKNHIVRVRRNGNDIWSGNSLRGVDFRGVVMDEWPLIAPVTWDEIIRPIIAQSVDRWVIFIFTPKGRNHAHRMWVKTKDNPEWGHYTLTAEESKIIPAEELVKIKTEVPAMSYAQEFMCEFGDDATSVFKGVDYCISGGYEAYREGYSYVTGVDLAKIEDWTVITTICRETRHVVSHKRCNNVEWSVQKEMIIDEVNKYKSMAVVDATGLGDPIFDDLRRVGVHARAFKFTNSSKKELIDRLCVVIEQRLITFPDIIELIDELKTYAYELTTARNIKYSAPEGMHDDCVISLGLAVWGCRNFLYNPKTLKENKKNKYRTQREENAGYGY